MSVFVKNSNLVLEDSNLIWEMSHDSENVICNFSSHDLSNVVKLLPFKVLKFPISPKHLDYVDHMLPSELLFRDIINNEMPSEDKEFIKNRLKYVVCTSFWWYNYNSKINLTHFQPMFHFYTTWKHEKTGRFLMFWGGIH